MSVRDIIIRQLQAALWECCHPNFAKKVENSPMLFTVADQVMEDALSFSTKDPAAGGEPLRIIQTYTSFRAVLHYRLAHSLYKADEFKRESEFYLALISSRGKILSGAEIDYRSRIGRRFILDHGVGTVIGEESQLGDDCYVLGGVVLGARGIAHNREGKRHPTIGNRVQIGAFTGIFGNIIIGDDVFIGTHCIITENIPSGSTVVLRSSLQVTKPPK